MQAPENENHINLAVRIVSAFVGNNAVTRSDLPALIESVHAALKRTASGAPTPDSMEAPTPAVSVRASMRPDYLICLDDGKKFKSLKRHLAALGMTPEQYRAKWKLRADYPMVAPNYAAQRSELALKIGLGRKARGVAEEEQRGARHQSEKPKPNKRKRGRSSKAARELSAA